MEKASQFSPVLPPRLTTWCLLRDWNQRMEHLTPVGDGFDHSDLLELDFVS